LPYWASNARWDFQPFEFREGKEAIMGNKDRRKEKKKLKQPKETPKPSAQSKLGITRPSK